MTEYDRTIDWLFKQVPMFQNVGADAYKPGLERVLALSAAFGNPHKKIKFIHVAGTNGKGSTSSNLASILTASGLRTGLFTSPHLIDFRERMRVDGLMIPKDEVVDFIRRYREMELDIEPSFFELTTVMALDYFCRSNVDIAVMETGLGGRLDSTNIIKPMLSIITNISFDHTALLGSTLEAIAREKAGIIKQGVPVVIGNADDPAVRAVFENTAREKLATIVFAKDDILFDKACLNEDSAVYSTKDFGTLTSPLTGDCQSENTNTVLHALKLLPFDIPKESIARGLKDVKENTGLQGRWTTVGVNPKIICDTGHNPGGWAFLGPRLQAMASEGDLRVVLGFVNDKDIRHILDKLPANASYYFATPSVSRGRAAAETAAVASEFGICGDAFDTVSDALEAAKYGADPERTTIFVGGSTFVVADLFAHCSHLF